MSVVIEDPRDLVEHARQHPGYIQVYINEERPSAEFVLRVLHDLRIQPEISSNQAIRNQLLVGIQALEDWFHYKLHEESMCRAEESNKLQASIQTQQEDLATRAEALAKKGLWLAGIAAFFAVVQIAVAGSQVWIMLKG